MQFKWFDLLEEYFRDAATQSSSVTGDESRYVTKKYIYVAVQLNCIIKSYYAKVNFRDEAPDPEPRRTKKSKSNTLVEAVMSQTKVLQEYLENEKRKTSILEKLAEHLMQNNN